jgi:ZIP family zinc transporter
MNNLLKTTLIGLFFGTFGTTIGGIIGVTFKNTSKKFLSFVLAFASGLMISIVCFDLIPEAFNLTGIVNIFIGIMFGIVTMIVCDILADKKFNNKIKFKDNKNTLLKTGIIVSIGLALHNFPEGLAIGSGFEASIKLGLSLAIAICLHDMQLVGNVFDIRKELEPFVRVEKTREKYNHVEVNLYVEIA